MKFHKENKNYKMTLWKKKNYYIILCEITKLIFIFIIVY